MPQATANGELNSGTLNNDGVGTHTSAGRLDSLTGLRFFAAVVVFGYHLSTKKLDFVFGQGRLGVSFFFILSGLVLTWAWRPTDAVGRFYRRRVARIYPAYLVALVLGLVVTLLLRDADHGVGSSVASVFLLQAWVPSAHTYFALNGVGWSLSTEAFFYLLFPFVVPVVARLTRRYRRVLQLCCLGVTFAVGIAGSITVPHAIFAPDTVAAWATYIFPLPRLAEFVLGVTLVAEIRERPLRVSRTVVIALALGAYFLARLDPSGMGTSAITVIPFCLLLVRMAQADLAGEYSPFRNRAVIRLGEASYCFYLVHQLVIRVVEHHVQPTSPARSAFVLVMTFVPSVVAAWLLHVLVERPADKRLRGPGRSEVVVDGSPASGPVARS